ncbi:hypothetical protein WA026_023244 [Henosepilachna vigintioctopunctata]|uniref:Uncharacterized protein n=1 Tax=Henosepilachna vigintioctopunctata TaxID=420089 RepID=A0AAW1VJI6_9CUCU
MKLFRILDETFFLFLAPLAISSSSSVRNNVLKSVDFIDNGCPVCVKQFKRKYHVHITTFVLTTCLRGCN